MKVSLKDVRVELKTANFKLTFKCHCKGLMFIIKCLTCLTESFNRLFSCLERVIKCFNWISKGLCECLNHNLKVCR